MLSPIFAEGVDISRWLSAPATLLFAAFQIWMFVDAIRREEWMWVLFLVFLPGFSALWYIGVIE